METWDKTCYIIQIRRINTWFNLSDTCLSSSEAARRHSTRDAASGAMARLNVQIRRGIWEYETTPIKVENIRIVEMCTTWSVVE